VTRSLRRLLAIVGVVVGLAHVAALPQTLEDLDSVNFALGVETFDISRHQPHPPGYPVYIAAAKISTAVVQTVFPDWPRDRRAAVGLAIWSVIAAVAAVWVMCALWMSIGLTPTQSLLAAVLATVSPLFWLTSSRPLTDMPGFVMAMAVQAVLFGGLRLVREDPDHLPRLWWWAAVGAGLTIGVRTQTMWLTGPLLFWCVGELIGTGRYRDAAKLIAASAAGVLVWMVPMLIAAGGWSVYFGALGVQGADDFIGVEMLATDPSWALLTEALARTFRTPWLHEGLATVVLILAGLGVVRLMGRSRRVLALMFLAFWPYCVFHLTFQETATIRYSLPLVAPVAALAIVAFSALARPVALGCSAALIAASLWIAQPPLAAYGASGAPIFRAFTDLEALSTTTPPLETVLGMHRRIASESRQALVWVSQVWPFTRLPSERGAEVLEVVEYWRAGGQGPLWFLANPARRDLDMIDARARHLHAPYRWHPDVSTLIAFSRPTNVDAWIIDPPRWMLGRGWAVTPEIGGVTSALGLGPYRSPVNAYLRRDPAPLRVVIGGRHLGAEGTPPVTLVAALDGVEVDRWTASTSTRGFQRWIELPAGIPAGEGPYATLAVWVDSDRRSPPVGLEFFDAATSADVLWTFDAGWHEPEQEPGTGLAWRWMERVGTLRIAAPSHEASDAPLQEMTLTITGDSPVKYFGRGTDFVVRAGTQELARRQLASDFTESVTVPAAALAAADGRLTIEVGDAYVPAERGRGADRRQLGLRVFTLTLTPRR